MIAIGNSSYRSKNIQILGRKFGGWQFIEENLRGQYLTVVNMLPA